MKEKGQALVEFILVVPVILLIFMSLIDTFNIFVKKHDLNNELDTVVSMYKNNDEKELKAYIALENIAYFEKNKNDMVQITLKKDVKVNTPFLSNVLGKEYAVTASKTVYKNE